MGSFVTLFIAPVVRCNLATCKASPPPRYAVGEPLDSRVANDLWIIVVRYSFEIGIDLIDIDPAESFQTIAEAIGTAAVLIQGHNPAEGLKAETRHALEQLESKRANSVRDRLDCDALERLQVLVKSV